MAHYTFKKIIYIPTFFLLQLSNTVIADSCNFLPESLQPDWINADSSIPGYYVGVGVSGKSRKGSDFQIKKSAQDAKRDLSENIQVTIKSQFLIKQSVQTDEDESNLEQEAESLTLTTSQASLKNVLTDAVWLDSKSCLVWTRVKVKKSVVENESHKQQQLANIVKLESLIDSIDTTSINTQVELHKLELSRNMLSDIDFDAIDSRQKDTFVLKIQQMTGLLKSSEKSTETAEKIFTDARKLLNKTKTDNKNKKQYISKALQNYHSILTQYPFNYDDNNWSEKAAYEIASLELQRNNPCAARVAIEKIINLSALPDWVLKAKKLRRKARCNTGDRITFNFRNTFDAKTVAVSCSYQLKSEKLWGNVCEKIVAHFNSQGAIAKIVSSLDQTTSDFSIHIKSLGNMNTRKISSHKEFQFNGDVISRIYQNDKIFLQDEYSGIGGWNPVSEKMAIEVLGIHVYKRFIKSLNKELEG